MRYISVDSDSVSINWLRYLVVPDFVRTLNNMYMYSRSRDWGEAVFGGAVMVLTMYLCYRAWQD